MRYRTNADSLRTYRINTNSLRIIKEAPDPVLPLFWPEIVPNDRAFARVLGRRHHL